MHLKRYRSGSVKEALAEARAELGPGALVLSTRLVAAPGLAGWMGRRVVEVTAAVDRKVSENRPSARVVVPPLADPAAGPTPVREGRDPSGWAFWRRAEGKETTDAVVARLCAAGLGRTLAEEVAGRVPRRQRRDASGVILRQALAEQLTEWAVGEEAHARCEVFVGPPGAGKTTTVAKIAAQQRARRGAKLGLVAADGFRVGAVEQLRLYAEIIGSTFHVARTTSELASVLGKACGPLLVDTAGRSPRDQEASALFELVGSLPGARTHLVLPAHFSVRAAERTLAQFAGARPTRVVLTRVDECDSLTPLVELCRERQLSISCLGTGQRVPEDLEWATPDRLAAYLLGETGAAAGALA